MERKREYRIDDIHFFQNEKYEGVDIAWGGPIGFGHLTIYKIVGEDKIYVDTEHLGKEFTKKILELVTKTIIKDAEYDYDELEEDEDNEN